MARALPILFFSILLMSVASRLNGQNHLVKGVIVDSSGQSLPGTTVVLTRASDSSMVKFALTDAEGKFRMQGIADGNYLLQMSYLGYQNFMMKVDLTPSDGLEKDLGRINMSEKTIEMNGVVIEADIIPIVFKKDTVEYNANAFKTQADAKVEDLLKRMPGIEVDAEGNLTAQGEKVQKVLVDGKEFFGQDPKTATRNLPAKAVDKVQVFDKQSDMAEFTGVDDGERMRTINLKLKEDYRQGVFGNAEAGGGADENFDPLRYKGRFSLNRFQKTTQISALGMLNNVNEQGFDVQDYVDFIGGMGNAMRTMGQGQGGGGNNNIPTSTNLNNGNVTSAAAGLNFNFTPSKKTRLNVSYFYSGLDNDVERNLVKTTFLEAGTFSTTESNLQNVGSGNHRLNLRLDQDLDSSTTLTIKATGLLQTGTNTTQDDRQNLNSNQFKTNQAIANFESNALNFNGDGEFQLKHRFKKAGRSLGANLKSTTGLSDGLGDLESLNFFYNPAGGTLIRVDTVNQHQENEGGQLKYSGEISYTEPIGKRFFMEGSYSHAYQKNLSIRDIFDIDETGTLQLNNLLSNRFENFYVTDVAGISLQRSGVKSSLTLGMKGEISALRGNLLLNDTTIRKQFINPLPRIRYRYQIAQSRRIEFNYNTNVSEPTIAQLSPIVDNSDPTRVSVGNPDLKAQYVHNARLGFFSFSPFSFTSIFANLSGSYTHNKITNSVLIDSNLVQTIRPVNVDRDINLNAFAGFGAPIKPLGMKFNLNARSGYNRGLVFVNQTLGNIGRLTQSGDFSLENRKKDKWDVRAGYKFTYSLTRYADNSVPEQQFFNQEIYADLTWDITPKWVLGSNFSYNLYGGEAFSGQTVALWKAYISRYLLKGNKMQVKLFAFDLLNQNTGVNRSSDLNFVQEETFQTVNRYVMLSLGYNILGFQKQQGGGQGMGRMMMMRP